ncbi:hypothetical protein BAUCODRAFT_24513 [Baudoinia panamericana UAMH 10762]|uniref:Myb-like domain-containing protein n=1 Tax=Baudoinia panamericana (strain UAMH 10762) TaxID=717646 RepID=M2NCA4_BAUPA|nr:uncharacterized protein BAUCODRAFT_24513 [Baudoinia panamericana UAMH 10762]EMC96814.1 hypothetical protein BAUCODRAFT_24513 [Baudoinia panamericana UAMH 10762]
MPEVIDLLSDSDDCSSLEKRASLQRKEGQPGPRRCHGASGAKASAGGGPKLLYGRAERRPSAGHVSRASVSHPGGQPEQYMPARETWRDWREIVPQQLPSAARANINHPRATKDKASQAPYVSPAPAEAARSKRIDNYQSFRTDGAAQQGRSDTSNGVTKHNLDKPRSKPLYDSLVDYDVPSHGLPLPVTMPLPQARDVSQSHVLQRIGLRASMLSMLDANTPTQLDLAGQAPPSKRRRTGMPDAEAGDGARGSHATGLGGENIASLKSELSQRSPSGSSFTPRTPCGIPTQAGRLESNAPAPPTCLVNTPAFPTKRVSTTILGPRVRYTSNESTLLARLKEVENLSWDQITSHFPNRTRESLQVHYSTKVKGRHTMLAVLDTTPAKPPGASLIVRLKPAAARRQDVSRPTRRRGKRSNGPSVLDGFVSWSQISQSLLDEAKSAESESDAPQERHNDGLFPNQGRAFQSPVSSILRRRELGGVGRRGWMSVRKGVPNELREHALSGYTLRKHFLPMSGDVCCLDWANDGIRFAAGSIAISDYRSMQYNSNCNLLQGDCKRGSLYELPEHHVSRPTISDENNVNALHSMRESQDDRLFKTVAALGFSPDGTLLYTAGEDRYMRVYVGDDHGKAECRNTFEHAAAVDLLQVSAQGLVATACHSSADGSVGIYKSKNGRTELGLTLSVPRADTQPGLPTFPSAIKWGVSQRHQSLLLAGFASDSQEEERNATGETVLWSVETGQRIDLGNVTRNVFDVAWNPIASSASIAFCVAGIPSLGKSRKSRRSVIQCYAPGQAIRQVLEWDCPAFDINDVVFCPYDDNLIAVGATDGRVYIWDQRFASRNQKPLHTLCHDESLNVLDHDRDREHIDTGVRFLSWGATSSRLFSASSDGVVKSWNPYMATSNAHVGDVASFRTAIMSGAFSPDLTDLLIGEECGRINLLSIDNIDEDGTVLPSRTFKLISAPVGKKAEPPFSAAHELLRTGQIELQSMGALPIRQAVQGPAYSGPYLKPSAQEWTAAQQAYQRALDKLSHREQDFLAGLTTDVVPSSQADGEIRAAENGVQSARAAVERLQSRHDAFIELESSAKSTQQAFHVEQKQRLRLDASIGACNLDCGFLPRFVDLEIGVPDSHRSEQRIPGSLRALPLLPVDVADYDCKQLFEAGLAGCCPYCPEKAQIPRLAPLLDVRCRQRCMAIRASLTGICEICNAPVRVEVDDEGQISTDRCTTRLCERCNFPCFRCSRPVQLVVGVMRNDYSIFCSACDMNWAVGILGYEPIVDEAKRESRKEKHTTRRRLSAEDSEMMRLHARWHTNHAAR